MVYQSLYRRYRPQKFGEIKGQAHVVAALQGAVRDDKVGHAYLFSGPRGTGKTSTARVLAKALNCGNLGADGEPCGVCESCVAIEQGRSFDLHELDAASNNKVDDMRALLERVNLGTPGRTKVYLLDEVHMLTPGAENALLKTLEEPPDHVTWVLATTEPHKVVETIRSRCQVLELSLLGADEMAAHVRAVVADAALDVDDDTIDYVVATGGGSVRDTLSALDRVVAAGGMVEIDASTDSVLMALAEHDPAAALTAVDAAIGRGRDPRTIGEAVLAGLRDAFLTAMGAPPPRLGERDRARAEDLAAKLPPPAITRALEVIGTALIDMRQAPDPRVDIEVAMVRLCRPAADHDTDALRARLEQLEARLGGGEPDAVMLDAAPEVAASAPPSEPDAAPEVAASAPPSEPDAAPEVAASADEPPVADGPAASARRALAQSKPATTAVMAPSAPPPAPPPPKVPVTDPSTMQPQTPSEVVELAERHLGFDRATVIARAREMLPPTEGQREPAELQPLWQSLVADGAPPVASPPDEPAPSVAEPTTAESDRAPSVAEPSTDEHVDLTDLVDAPSHTEDLIERLSEAFPGAELVTTDDEESR